MNDLPPDQSRAGASCFAGLSASLAVKDVKLSLSYVRTNSANIIISRDVIASAGSHPDGYVFPILRNLIRSLFFALFQREGFLRSPDVLAHRSARLFRLPRSNGAIKPLM